MLGIHACLMRLLLSFVHVCLFICFPLTCLLIYEIQSSSNHILLHRMQSFVICLCLFVGLFPQFTCLFCFYHLFFLDCAPLFSLFVCAHSQECMSSWLCVWWFYAYFWLYVTDCPFCGFMLTSIMSVYSVDFLVFMPILVLLELSSSFKCI